MHRRRDLLSLGALSLGGLFLPSPAAAATTVVRERRLNATTIDLTVRSPSLARPEKVRLLVPRGWSRRAGRTWPVVYAFHGGRDDYRSWTRGTDIERLAARADVIVAMPATGWAGWFTDWRNHGAGGPPRWETFHTKELPALLERRYRAGRKRAAIGISSAGYGAVKYAARHPGAYAYAASFSGILHLTLPGVPPLVLLQSAEAEDPFRIWGAAPADWRRHDPYHLAPRLRGVGLYLSSGRTGLPGPHEDPESDVYPQLQEALCGATTASFADRLKRLRIPATTHLYRDGGHNWNVWEPELHAAWPLMMKALGVPAR